MKNRLFLCLFLAVWCWPMRDSLAVEPVEQSPVAELDGLVKAIKKAADEPALKDGRLPGVVLSEGISQITGTAVSPLLGMSAVGAWKYFNTPESQRHLLPWYCHHYVWGTFTVILAMCFLKDTLGAAVPALVKKPLDFVELFEDKLSALVVSGAFVPLIASTIARMEQVAPPDGAAVFSADMGFATWPMLGLLDGYWAKFAMLFPLCLGAFLVVWLACHSINVIIAMSPFGLVDLSLKLFKLGLLGVITLAAFISPFLGLLVCVPLIIIGFLTSGWTFRLTVFGTVMGYDVLTRRKAQSAEVHDQGIWAFNAKPMGKTPVRSFGIISCAADGKKEFSYRPWLVLPTQKIMLSEAINGVERGVLFPSLITYHGEQRSSREMVLLPRYVSCVPKVAEQLGLEKVNDSLLVKGLKTAKQRWYAVVSFITGRAKWSEPQMG